MNIKIPFKVGDEYLCYGILDGYHKEHCFFTDKEEAQKQCDILNKGK